MQSPITTLVILSSFLIASDCTRDGKLLYDDDVTTNREELAPTTGTLRGNEFEIERVNVRVFNHKVGELVSEHQEWYVVYQGSRIRCRDNTPESCAHALQMAIEKGNAGEGSGGSS